MSPGADSTQHARAFAHAETLQYTYHSSRSARHAGFSQVSSGEGGDSDVRIGEGHRGQGRMNANRQAEMQKIWSQSHLVGESSVDEEAAHDRHIAL